jgi:hypothetical protein
MNGDNLIKYSTQYETELAWRYWKPRGIANVAMGDAPVTQMFINGVIVQEFNPAPRKGRVKSAKQHVAVPQVAVPKPGFVTEQTTQSLIENVEDLF